MMKRAILYYISGHGMGHARRCAQSIRMLNKLRPDLSVHIRTMADPAIFADLNARVVAVPIDRGAVEIDACTINWPATLDHVRGLLAGSDRLVEDESRYIRDQNISLIVADVPFMAGYVAHAAGVPCYAHSNFMWDWIYEPNTGDRKLLDAIAGGYRRMAGWLRLPFPHACSHFRRIIDVPFVTSPLTLTPQQARAHMGIAEDDNRPVILIGMRGGTDRQILENLRAAQRDYLFITTDGPIFENGGAQRTVRFWDALQICRAVVSKPGHGIITDCATMGVALLYPERNGFREDGLTLSEGARYFRNAALPQADYLSGRWKPHLDMLLAPPKPKPATNTNGGEFVADWIIGQLGLQ